MLRGSFRPAFFVLMLVVLASCGGAGGCSGCAGCGMTPLTGGFDATQRIENAGAARVTQSGLKFLQANIPGLAKGILGSTGTITFDIPKSSSSVAGITANICPNGSDPTANPEICVAELDVPSANLTLATAAPEDLHITGTIPLRVQDLQVSFGCADLNISIDGDGSCPGSSSAAFDPFPIDVDIAIKVDQNATHTARLGYSAITINSILDQTTATGNLDSNLHICGIPSCNALCCISNLCTCAVAGIAGALQSTIVGQLYSQLQGTLQSTIDNQLCTKATATAPCPTGTTADSGGICRYSDNTCVSMLLGTDGHMNLGTLVAKFSPGVTAGLDILLAAGGPDKNTTDATATSLDWGDLDPVGGGMTLGLYGGAEAAPASACVPAVKQTIPTGIPIPTELFANTVTPWPTSATAPDLGIALAGRYIGYALTSAYNSGVLCLGVSTAQFQALSTGFVSAVIPSIKDLTFEPGKSSKPASMALTTRPQKPPVVVLGNGTDVNKDPLLKITLPTFAIDFYVWSLDRYIRAFTYTADVTIPVNLQTGADPKTNPTGGIVPVLGDLGIANGVVTNSDLVWEKPTQLASALSSLLGGIVGQFLGKGFNPININGSFAKYGLALDLPPNAFRKLTMSPTSAPGGKDDYIGLFANLTTAPAGMVRTAVRITGMEIHPEAMSLTTADRAKFPKLNVDVSSPDDDGSRPLEYTYWVDDQPRAAWTSSHDLVVDDSYLFLQGKHTLHAAARVVGHPESEDDNPAQAPFVVDVLSPVVSLETQSGEVTVHAYDYVSDDSALTVRWRPVDPSGEGAWSAWQPYPSVSTLKSGGDGVSIEVQVQDEAGNVADTNGLIRGRPDPTLPSSGSACGCSTPGSPDTGRTGVLVAFGAIVALGVLARRRRAGALVIGSLGVMAAATPGCSCGSNNNASAADGGTGCGPGCMVQCGLPDAQGLIGAYTSVAVAQDGTVWVAGYNDADVTNGLLYGDLVAGKLDKGKMKVAWVTVDGLPPEPGDGDCPPNDPSTWRHGLTDPGPDVGLWTSIQLDASGNPMVSYYDATNAALKFASSQDGGQTWQIHTVMQAANSDIGRYSKMLVLGGKPVIAFLVVEPGTGGWAQSRVVLATGNVALPAQQSDWTTQNVIVDAQTPCKAQLCTGNQVCVQATGQCQAPVAGCTPSDCGQSEAGIGSTPQSCVTLDAGPACEAITPSSYIDTYPDAEGDYLAIANGPKGLGVVVYDRTRGNLVGAASESGAWTAQILDGQIGPNSSPTRTDTGDVGVGASLAIDASGDWHVSYSNAWTETLQYLHVPGGDFAKPLTPEVVDDGLHVNGTANPDGQHIVGDDSSITVDASGTVRIVYQDATAGTLHEAIGTAAGSGHTWAVKVVPQANQFAGFFPHYVSQVQQIANWYRATDHTQSPPMVTGDVAFVAP